MSTRPSRTPIRIWDLPTRLFHWLLVLLVTGMFVTATLGGLWMDWHVRLGQAMCGLLLFRLLWGILGGRWSRFSSLRLQLSALMQQLSGQSPASMEAGHSPSGSWSVVIMLLALLTQTISGLFSSDDIAFAGPLAAWVSSDSSRWFTRIHLWGQNLILALLALHILAVLFQSLVRGKTLMAPMLTGDKPLPADTPASRDTPASWLLALLLLCLCVAFAWWLGTLSSPLL